MYKHARGRMKGALMVQEMERDCLVDLEPHFAAYLD